MLTLSAAALEEKNKIASDGAWLLLLELQLGEEVIKVVRNNVDITWNGATWTAFSFELDDRVDTSKGNIPSVGLRISNVSQLMQSYAETYDGAIGQTVILRLVHSDHLDLVDAEIEETFTIIECSTDSTWVYVTLGLINPFILPCPRHRYIKNFCRWEFKSGECGYSGEEASCNKTLSNCEARNNEPRFGGFPGIPFGGGIFK